MDQQYSAFISHSSKDKAVAEKLVADLESKGLTCWIAPRNIPPGTDWTEQITRGIRASKCFVLLYSEASNLSDDVYREVRVAVGGNKPIYPVMLENVPFSDRLEYYISSSQWIDALEGLVSAQIERLKSAIQAGDKWAETQAITDQESKSEYCVPLLFDPPILPKPKNNEVWSHAVPDALLKRLNAWKIDQHGRSGSGPLTYIWTGPETLSTLVGHRRVFDVHMHSNLVLRNFDLPLLAGKSAKTLRADRFGRVFLVCNDSLFELERGLRKKPNRVKFGMKLGNISCEVVPNDFEHLVVSGDTMEKHSITSQVLKIAHGSVIGSWHLSDDATSLRSGYAVSCSLGGKYISLLDRFGFAAVFPSETASGGIDPAQYRPKVSKKTILLSIAWHPRFDQYACTFIRQGQHGFCVFDANSGAVAFEQEIPRRGHAKCIDWSPDGRFLAMGGEDHAVFLWDFERGRLVALLGHEYPVNRVKFSPDGQRLLTDAFGTQEKTCIWDPLQPDAPIFSCPLSTVGIFGSAWSTDGRRFAGFGPYPGNFTVYRLT